jgi:hypothetical protein
MVTEIDFVTAKLEALLHRRRSGRAQKIVLFGGQCDWRAPFGTAGYEIEIA